jgi:hypothetical protein
MRTITAGVPGNVAQEAKNQGEDCMLGLKIMGACWVTAIVATPLIGTIDPADASEKLMTGSAQVVLAVVVLGLSVAIIWVVKRLLKSHDERVEEAKANAKLQVEQANCYTNEMTKALSDNSTALAANATASQQLKEAVFHLSAVVDKKMDKN